MATHYLYMRNAIIKSKLESNNKFEMHIHFFEATKL